MEGNAIGFIFQLAVLVMSVVIHEVSHGFVAYAMGDSTAKYQGRLTLNPIPHIDPIGSIILPLLLSIPALFGQPTVLIGWAKPVPYNPYNLSNQKWGPGLVAVAGPLSNILIACIFGLVLRFGSIAEVIGGLALLEPFVAIVIINIMLALFNLVPIPPLDGSKVLYTFLPYRLEFIYEALERYGFILLLIFIFYFSDILVPIALFAFRFITGLSF